MELNQLRKKVDCVDEEILSSLYQRAKICQEIGIAKKTKKLPIRNAERETQVYAHVRKKADELGLDPAKIEAVFREIVNICSSVQE